MSKIEEFVVKNTAKLLEPKTREKGEKVRKYRTEASRLASMANKRLKRLEQSGLTDSPAYQKWAKDGKVKFSVRGKSHRELQKEVSRMNQFINSQTSTIRGVNTQLKDMAKNTGIKYKNLKELRNSAKSFFELASKVEQYLRTVDNMASAIGYQKIWTAINKYVKEDKIALDGSVKDVDKMVKKVSDAMMEFEKKEQYDFGSVHGWYRLDKEE